jgi:hypothetical protein
MGRPHPALIDVAAGRRPAAATDPAALLRSAFEHRMGGLLLTEVLTGRFRLEPEATGVLTQADLAVRAHQERLWVTLETAVERLAAEGFTVATIKGLAAQRRWYQRAGERPCVDVDLVVAPADTRHLSDIVAILAPDHPHRASLGALVASGYLRWADVELAPGQWLDLHVDPFKLGLPVLQAEAIWQRMIPFPLPGGGTVLATDAEISLILFLLHLNKDRFRCLIGFADVRRLLAAEDLDWAFIDRFLRREGLETPVRLGLDTVVAVLGIPHPQPVVVGGWRARVWKALWPVSSAAGGQTEALRRRRRQFYLPFLIRGRVIEALRWWFRLALPPRLAVERWYGDGTRRSYLGCLVGGRLRQWRAQRRLLHSDPDQEPSLLELLRDVGEERHIDA